MLDHGHILGARARPLVLRQYVPRIVRRDGGLAGHLIGPMRRRVSDVQEEWFVLVLVDEPTGPLRHEVGGIAAGLDAVVVFPKIRLTVAVVMRVVIVIAALQ